MNKFGKKRRVMIVNFAEDKEIFPTRVLRSFLDRREKSLPELFVDVFHCIQAKPGNIETLDPIRINIDHASDNAKLFGKQIVEAGDVSILGTFTAGRGFASVVINGWII